MTRALTRIRPGVAIAADAVCLVVFAAIGRHSHQERDNLLGVLTTASPFLIGAAVGWVAVRGWRAPSAIVPTGVSVWLCAVWIGVLLRKVFHQGASDQGIAWSFVLVASIATAVFLLGWRLAVNVVAVRSGR